MNIGVLGSGRIGATLARHFARAGHDVVVGSRRPETLEARMGDTGPLIRPGTSDDAAAFGELVVLALHWEHAVLEGELPPLNFFESKIVVDAMNPYRLNGGGYHALGASTSSERVAELLPGARLVKAFNTIFWEQLRDNARPGDPEEERQTVFLAGDDIEAVQVVADLIEAIGFAAVSTGGLRAGGLLQQPGTALYNCPMTPAQARLALEQAQTAA